MYNCAFAHLPGCHPDDGEDAEDDVAQPVPLGVLAQLGELQDAVGHVVRQQHQRPDADKVARVGEEEQEEGDDVVDDHLPK